MGSVSLKIGDGTARFRRSTLCSSALHLLMLASVLTTNLFALYAFTSSPTSSSKSSSASDALRSDHNSSSSSSSNLSLISEHVSLILREIDASQRRLHQIERELSGFDSLHASSPGLPPELRAFLSPHPLPLGPDSRSRLTHMLSSVSHLCSRSLPLLSRFMSYSPHSPCPAPDPPDLLLSLLSKSCLPLPRRRCLSRPLPAANLSLPVDGRRWTRPRWKADFPVDDVLALASPGGGVRVGFDVAGGAADFAASMAGRGVTVVTSVVDSPGRPLGELVAARGLFPLLLPPALRFPFYDAVFDLVRVSAALDEAAGAGGRSGRRQEALEFFMFDVDRVLRVGGLLWIDNYLCADDERKRAVTRLVDRFAYKKLRWVVAEKADPGKKSRVYLSAVLQKPPRVSKD